MASNSFIQENIVEGILKRRIDANGKKQYLIQWEGSNCDQATWENEENISGIKNLIEEFESKLKKDQEEKDYKNIIDNIMESLDNNIPSKVISCRLYNDILLCFCEFEESSDGLITEPCYIPNKVLREYFPKILIDFYETKVYFVNQ